MDFKAQAKRQDRNEISALLRTLILRDEPRNSKEFMEVLTQKSVIF